MHLCDACAESRDWTTDPSALNRIALQAQAPPDRKAICGDCRTPLHNPLFHHCERCAKREALCQNCGRSTLTPEEAARRETEAALEEEFQRLLDLFTASRKMFGITRTIDMFGVQRDELGAELVDRALLLDADKLENDPERRKRSIWKLVYGTLRFGTPPPRCEACATLRTPHYCRATDCGHWTVGLAARWCFPCAVERGRCATCSIPTLPSEASPE